MLVAAAGPRHVIARPSIVLGDSRTGAIRGFDTIYAAFKLIAEGRVSRMPARACATLDFVPIDHVARGLVALARTVASVRSARCRWSAAAAASPIAGSAASSPRPVWGKRANRATRGRAIATIPRAPPLAPRASGNIAYATRMFNQAIIPILRVVASASRTAR